MSTMIEEQPAATAERKKASTAHIKVVPESRETRDKVRDAARVLAAKLDRSRGFTRDELRALADALLRDMGLGTQYSGFAAVCIANEFWREQVQAIPFNRRLLLLPHCLKHAEGCPADYDEFGLDCRKCGACSVADFKTKAEDLGYKVLVSEGTPIVLKIIVSGHVDAIVGVACLNVLERAFDKILLAGVPCVATPLLSSNCKSTSVDEDWVMDMIQLETPPAPVKTRSFMPLLRAANALCEQPELSRLAPGPRADMPASDPLRAHEDIAYSWMAQGGKRSRPFITLAAYDAMLGGAATRGEAFEIPDPVKRAALAIEAFHKASLIHDDIEDGDAYRYGMETLHRRHGVGPAINIGDYLVGWGYRLLARDRQSVGPVVAADLLAKFSDAHVKLAEGQGAELLWRQGTDKVLKPIDALRIYALKTAPAFEAALGAGIRLAGDHPELDKTVTEFGKNLGIAFQILNDLKDFEADGDNKVIAGQDVLASRPTVLLALALETLPAPRREELLALVSQGDGPDAERVARVKYLYDLAGVFDKAERLVDKFRAKAEDLADSVAPDELRHLLLYLVDSVLDGSGHVVPEAQPQLQAGGLLSLPVA